MNWTGLMFVGDKGIILDNEIIPKKKMSEYLEGKEVHERERRRGGGNSLWIDAFKGGSPSPGNFQNAKNIAETICLAAVAMQANTLQSERSIAWDSENFKITNIPEANEFLYREYRKGWEL